MEEIRKFLSEPEEHQDEFWESDALIWVDWRDFDESIINYFNEKLPDADKIQFECAETEKERGVDIFMKKNGVSAPIPYADDCTDRDTILMKPVRDGSGGKPSILMQKPKSVKPRLNTSRNPAPSSFPMPRL